MPVNQRFHIQNVYGCKDTNLFNMQNKFIIKMFCSLNKFMVSDGVFFWDVCFFEIYEFYLNLFNALNKL